MLDFAEVYFSVLILLVSYIGFYFYNKKQVNFFDAFIEIKNKNIEELDQKIYKLIQDHIETQAAAEADKATIKSLEINNNELSTKLSHAEENSKLQKEMMNKMEEKLHTSFENLSNKILQDKMSHFTKKSNENMDQILKPFKEQLTKFDLKINEVEKGRCSLQTKIEAEIKNMIQINDTMRTEAEKLANALRGDIKTQGNWGEVILDKILEASGLRENKDYTIQETIKDSQGNLLRPDVIVKLPGNKNIVIDSKVSLISYSEYYNSSCEIEKKAALKKFKISINNHINDLVSKHYNNATDALTIDSVVLFIPIEGAFSLAIQNSHELHEHAWKKKVILASPTILFSAIKTIESLWKIEKQNKNVKEIAEIAGKIYDEVVHFTTHMDDIKKNIEAVNNCNNKALKSYDAAVGRLKYGKGSIVSYAEKMKKLGANKTKELQKEFLPQEEIPS